MKEYLNRKELKNGKIILKMIKMGADIDEETNHRIRGVLPTNDGKNLFIEILAGHRYNYQKDESKKNYPHELYVYCDSCFRVDIPYDYYNDYTKEYSDIDGKPFYKIKYDKNGILDFFQKFNKKITDIELVDRNYIEEYCDENGFYRLYDDRLKHEYKPEKIKYKNENEIVFDMRYTCYNYDESIKYTEKKNKAYTNYDIELLKDEYGDETITALLKDYDEHLLQLKQQFAQQHNDFQI